LHGQIDAWYALHELHPSYGKPKSAVSRHEEDTAPLITYKSGHEGSIAALDVSGEDKACINTNG
jgi:hypothetical protein